MKKIVTAIILLVLSVGVSYAQVPRNPGDIGDNAGTQLRDGSVSSYTNVSSLGLNITGNPGYIALSGSDQGGDIFLYYLWVDETGDLLLASTSVLDNFSSFPTGDWRNLTEARDGIVKVGGQ